MKKRILLLIVMLLTITVTSAQTAGATFDAGEFAYIVLADVSTVEITGKSAAGFTDVMLRFLPQLPMGLIFLLLRQLQVVHL